jgi:hypothetical protein
MEASESRFLVCAVYLGSLYTTEPEIRCTAAYVRRASIYVLFDHVLERSHWFRTLWRRICELWRHAHELRSRTHECHTRTNESSGATKQRCLQPSRPSTASLGSSKDCASLDDLSDDTGHRKQRRLTDTSSQADTKARRSSDPRYVHRTGQ